VKPLKHRPLTQEEVEWIRYESDGVKAAASHGSRWETRAAHALIRKLRGLRADGVTLQSIATVLGVTRERVRQVLDTPLPED
jgi:hypothetical protein